MPDPSETQLLASALGAIRLAEAEALFRLANRPTAQVAKEIIEAFAGASKAMMPKDFGKGPCNGIHVMSMCLPPRVFEFFRRVNDAVAAGKVTGEDGKPIHW